MRRDRLAPTGVGDVVDHQRDFGARVRERGDIGKVARSACNFEGEVTGC